MLTLNPVSTVFQALLTFLSFFTLLMMLYPTVQSYADKHAPPQFYGDDMAIGVILTNSSSYFLH